jgi:hypothetical protein
MNAEFRHVTSTGVSYIQELNRVATDQDRAVGSSNGRWTEVTEEDGNQPSIRVHQIGT